MYLSISQLSELTGRDRRTVAGKLADVPHTAGERGAMLYESSEALPLIYGGQLGSGAGLVGPQSGVVKRRAGGRFTKATHPAPNRPRYDG